MYERHIQSGDFPFLLPRLGRVADGPSWKRFCAWVKWAAVLRRADLELRVTPIGASEAFLYHGDAEVARQPIRRRQGVLMILVQILKESSSRRSVARNGKLSRATSPAIRRAKELVCFLGSWPSAWRCFCSREPYSHNPIAPRLPARSKTPAAQWSPGFRPRPSTSGPTCAPAAPPTNWASTRSPIFRLATTR